MKKMMGWIAMALALTVALLLVGTNTNSILCMGTSRYIRDCTSWFEHERQRFEDSASHELGFGTGVMRDGTRFEWFAWRSADGLLTLVLNERFRGPQDIAFRDALGREWMVENFEDGGNPPAPFKSSLFQTYRDFKKEKSKKSNRATLDELVNIPFPFFREMKVSVYQE